MNYPQESGGKPGAPLWLRIRGCIAMVLAIALLSIAGYATSHNGDQNVQIPCMIAGLLYMMTALGMAADSFDGKS